MCILPETDKIRRVALNDFVRFFFITGEKKKYYAPDVFFFYSIFCKKRNIPRLSKESFFSILRSAECVEFEKDGKKSVFFCSTNFDCEIAHFDRNVIGERNINVSEFCAAFINKNNGIASIRRSDLYREYRAWMIEKKLPPLPRNRFYLAMSCEKAKSTRDAKGWIYLFGTNRKKRGSTI